MIEIEAVTVCVGYADFLAETVKWNKKFIRKWMIVTEPGDTDTLSVCHRHNLDTLTTYDFRRNGRAMHEGKVFNKGRAIQRGLNALSCKAWVLHLDADIVLPPEFMDAMEMAHLDEGKIYGCDRQMVVGWDAWQRIQASGYRQHGMHCYVLPHDKYPVGTRWASPRDGYVPIGFFQLTHGSNLTRSGIWNRPYPDHHGHAARSDVQFGLSWDRRDRELLPELIVWHLESEPSKVGKNWNGRVSKPFGPEPKTAQAVKTASPVVECKPDRPDKPWDPHRPDDGHHRPYHKE